MKKIFTFLLFTGLTSFSFAQNGRITAPSQNPHRVMVRTPAGGSYTFTAKQRERAVAKIHRRYARKIREVNGRLFASRHKKMELTRQLEHQRDIEIGRMNARYHSNRNRAYRPSRTDRRRY